MNLDDPPADLHQLPTPVHQLSALLLFFSKRVQSFPSQRKSQVLCSDQNRRRPQARANLLEYHFSLH